MSPIYGDPVLQYCCTRSCSACTVVDRTITTTISATTAGPQRLNRHDNKHAHQSRIALLHLPGTFRSCYFSIVQPEQQYGLRLQRYAFTAIHIYIYATSVR